MSFDDGNVDVQQSADERGVRVMTGPISPYRKKIS